MRKRIASLLLTVCLLLTTPVLAAQDTSENFVRSRTYSGQFSDVTEESVFYDNVAALYEYGLSVGKGDGTFGLQDTMSVGQIVIFAGRIRSLYRTGDPEAPPPTPPAVPIPPSPTCSICKGRACWAQSWTAPVPPGLPPPGPRWPMCWQAPSPLKPCPSSTMLW
mgnify:CR=1 FL=1